MRQAAIHKQFKMKFTEKVQRRTRNVIITFTIICLTPLCEKGRTLSGAHSINAFAEDELVCVIDLGNEMYSSHGLETGLNYQLIHEFAKDNHCRVKVIAARSKDNYLDSLRKGAIDIVITNEKEVYGSSDSVSILNEMCDRSVWAMSGSDKNQICGDTEVKGEVKAPKATIDNVEAKSAFKSPNISDGMAAGGGGGGKVSAKLKTEDAPEK